MAGKSRMSFREAATRETLEDQTRSLTRDHAVDMAMNHDAPTDEINKR
jgi:hypothetical protein